MDKATLHYRIMSVCTSFVFGAVATISWALVLSTEIVATAPSEKLVHADTIRYVSLSLFHVPDIFSLFTLSLDNSYLYI